MEEKEEQKNVFMGPEFVSKDMGRLWQWYENMFNATKLYTKKMIKMHRRDGSVVKNIFYSCKGFEFGS